MKEEDVWHVTTRNTWPKTACIEAQLQVRFKLELPTAEGQIAGRSADLCPLLKAKDLVGENPVVKARLKTPLLG